MTPDATRGGTFTVTNHGISGSLLGTPILNQPQAGILGVGAIVKRPVVRSASASLLPSADDAIVIRPMCYLSLTFDHRVLDGAAADAFMSHVVRHLASWPVDAIKEWSVHAQGQKQSKIVCEEIVMAARDSVVATLFQNDTL